MLAASYWSLLAPAIGMAEDSGKYGSFAFLPVAVGFSLGAAFVYFADLAMPLLVRNSCGICYTVFSRLLSLGTKLLMMSEAIISVTIITIYNILKPFFIKEAIISSLL